MEINKLMSQYWGLGETNTIARLKGIIHCFENITIDQQTENGIVKIKKKKLKF